MRTYKIISTDGHCEAHHEFWHKYVPAQHIDRAPRVIPV